MDALDQLLYRPPVASHPLSLLVRPPPTADLRAVLDRCLALLAGRSLPDEIFVLLPEEPRHRLPGRWGHRAVRLAVRADAANGPALAWALDHARWPTIVTVDHLVSLAPTELAGMLKELDHADLIVAVRQYVTWQWDGGRGPLGRLARHCFGVPVLDPLSPIKGMRRSAVSGVVLQTSVPLCEFELVAKLTFITSLMDEVSIGLARADAEPLLGTVLRDHADEVADLFRRPSFWHVDPTAPRFRAALGEKPALSLGHEGPHGGKALARMRLGVTRAQRYLSRPRTLS